MDQDVIFKAGQIIEKNTGMGTYCVLALVDLDGYPTASTITASKATVSIGLPSVQGWVEQEPDGLTSVIWPVFALMLMITISHWLAQWRLLQIRI